MVEDRQGASRRGTPKRDMADNIMTPKTLRKEEYETKLKTGLLLQVMGLESSKMLLRMELKLSRKEMDLLESLEADLKFLGKLLKLWW